MPAIPLVPPILARHAIASSVSETDNRKGGIFAGVAILIIFVVALSIFIKYRALQVASAARKKAIADQKTWFASTRPVMRRSQIPHLLGAYTRAPNPQAGDHRGESSVSGAPQLPALNPTGSSFSVCWARRTRQVWSGGVMLGCSGWISAESETAFIV
jgi:hypothetical protein